MRIARVGAPGRERAALQDENGVIKYLPEDLGDIDGQFWIDGRRDQAEKLLTSNSLLESVDRHERFAAPITKPEKVICIGLNYREHARETGSPIPEEPIIFMKAPNCVVGPNDQILVPRGSRQTDWEVELGVVIGARARYLDSVADAAKVIAGYCVSHDVSEREFQLERGGQWDKGKSCETFNPLGPWLVTPAEVPDPQALGLRLSVNGVLRQDGNTNDMIFDVPYIVWYLSQFMVLEPGDLINTGTPKGVSLGHDGVPFLRAGDIVEVSIDGLGAQRGVLAQA